MSALAVLLAVDDIINIFIVTRSSPHEGMGSMGSGHDSVNHQMSWEIVSPHVISICTAMILHYTTAIAWLVSCSDQQWSST